jgi:Tol biopolymer transport system component/DNA-binding winged helix-turn-helix (wHTH) protein
MSSAKSGRHHVRFRSFAFDLDRRELTREGRPVKLHPQPARVLALLLEQAGEIVDREEIKQKVWADSHVDFDLGINSCIRQIRIAPGDEAEQPKFVETVTREGYRFIAAVETMQGQGRAPQKAIVFGMVASLLILVGVLGWILLSGDGSKEGSSPPSRTSPFTTLPGWEFDPAISPDGNFVVFAASERRNTYGHLHVKQIGSDEILQLTDAEAGDTNPAWSPDGRRIAFLRYVEGEVGSDIFTVPVLGGQERRLASIATRDETGPRWKPGLDWSPDGQILAFADKGSRSEQDGIFLLSLETMEKKRLTTPPADEVTRDSMPAFSPDGRYLAFKRGSEIVGHQIQIVAVSGGEPKLLHDVGDGMIYDLDWVSNGSAIVFAVEGLGRKGLGKISVKGGKATRLGVGESAAVSVSISGSNLVYMDRTDTNCNLWRMPGLTSNAHDSPHTQLTDSTRADFQQRISPEGTKLAFTSLRSGFSTVWTCDSDGSGCSEFSEYASGNPSWSPDGTALAFSAWREENMDIYAMDVDGGFPRLLTTAESGDAQPSWSKDGRSIFFSSNRTGELQIWKIPSEGGQPVQVTTGGGMEPIEHGRFIYYVKLRAPASYKWVDLWQVSIEGGTEEPVLMDLFLQRGNWTIWEESVVYRDRVTEGGPSVMRSFNLATQEVEKIYEFDSTTRFCFGTSVSMDGKWIFYSKGEPSSGADIMLVENFQ